MIILFVREVKIMEKFGIPLALGMALSENPDAMQVFSHLPENKRQQIISGTHTVKSKEEMQKYVNDLVQQYKKGAEQ